MIKLQSYLSWKLLKRFAVQKKKGFFDDDDEDEYELSPNEVDGILTMMKSLDPKDTLEMIYGAQIISTHVTGLRMLSKPHNKDKVLGLNLLRFSSDSIERLQKKRLGGSCQNINITYNHLGSGILQTKTGG